MRTNEGVANWFNVVDYGADPTGAADSYTAIAAAITAAGAGGVVYFPAGTYLLSTYLSPLARQRLVGDGQRQSFLKSTDATNSANCIQITANDVTIERLGFLGQTGKAGIVSDILLYTVGASRALIQDCYFDGNGQRCIFITALSDDCVIRRCHLEGTIYSNALEVNDSNGVHISDVLIQSSAVSVAETGIEIFGQAATQGRPILRFTIRDCVIITTGNNGINTQGGVGGTISGCTIREVKGTGILIMATAKGASFGFMNMWP